MKKGTKTSIKSDVATSFSSSVGATIGMIIGSAVSAEVNAMEATVSEPTPPKPEPVKPEPLKPEPPKPEPPKPEPPKPEPPKPEPAQQEPEIEVLGYNTVVNEDGSAMDVAVISVDGQRVAFIDVDRDDLADVYVLDMNENGMLENEEFVPIRDQYLPMQQFREAVYPAGDMLAQEDDYINDANVDEFMA